MACQRYQLHRLQDRHLQILERLECSWRLSGPAQGLWLCLFPTAVTLDLGYSGSRAPQGSSAEDAASTRGECHYRHRCFLQSEQRRVPLWEAPVAASGKATLCALCSISKNSTLLRKGGTCTYTSQHCKFSKILHLSTIQYET